MGVFKSPIYDMLSNFILILSLAKKVNIRIWPIMVKPRYKVQRKCIINDVKRNSDDYKISVYFKVILLFLVLC